jgi:CheY-like chemotaxis protein
MSPLLRYLDVMRSLRRLPEWPVVTHAEIVRRARILVIDDGEFTYMKLFERDGYTIQQWADVKDLATLETGEFDLILLDLIGVGLAESADEGFGLLKHIRATSPAQIVVAYSNSDLSLAYHPFFRDADAVLHKTKTDYVEFKRTVDRLLNDRFSLGFYITRVTAELGEHTTIAPKATEKARRAILTGDIEPLRAYLGKKIDDVVTIDRVIALVSVAISIAGLWKS